MHALLWPCAGVLLILLASLKKLLGVVDLSHGSGTANTALVYHGEPR